MPILPHYVKTHRIINEPIYKKLFEVQYITNDLTPEQCLLLTENTNSIKKNFICLNVNQGDDGGIPIFKLLRDLKKFSLNVLIHDKPGIVLGKFVYKNCTFPNLEEDMVDFSWHENDDILRPKFEICYETLEYVDAGDFKRYDRQQKLERLLIQNPDTDI